MRFIPTLLHGIADYLVGIVVIGMPIYFGFAAAPRIALISLGALVVVYSLVTEYELGALRYLRIRFPLALDMLFGILMLIIPFLFTLPSGSAWPVYTLGLLAIFLSATTEIRAAGTASTNKKDAY
jgi:hypothetical protein